MPGHKTFEAQSAYSLDFMGEDLPIFAMDIEADGGR